MFGFNTKGVVRHLIQDIFVLFNFPKDILSLDRKKEVKSENEIIKLFNIFQFRFQNINCKLC